MFDRLYSAFENVYSYGELAFPTTGVTFTHRDRIWQRPYVVYNMVSSVDGKATTSPGGLEGLGSMSDRKLMQRLRAQVDAVAIGGGTLRVDPFIPTLPHNLVEERSQFFPDKPQPLGIVISNSGDLPLEHRFWLAGRDLRIIFLGASASQSVELRLSEKARVFRLPNDPYMPGINLARMLEVMFVNFGIQRLLVEGGPSLNYALISEGWCDEIFLTLSPKLVGGLANATTIAGEGYGLGKGNLLNLKLRSIYHHEDELYLRYQILKQAISG
jgi:2,5-diamino-6-(ribosylamino)-4(3H)-pyrimidinone 5'-phosphate reductase